MIDNMEAESSWLRKADAPVESCATNKSIRGKVQRTGLRLIGVIAFEDLIHFLCLVAGGQCTFNESRSRQ